MLLLASCWQKNFLQYFGLYVLLIASTSYSKMLVSQLVCFVVDHASSITKYIYNHCYPLYLMRKFIGVKEILRPTPTRFATNFITLQSILVHKDNLRAMVTSRERVSSAYAKDSKGKRFVDSVLNSTFWEECASIIRMTEPLVRVLRIVDSDDRPTMRYLYEAIHSAKEEMLRRFQRKELRCNLSQTSLIIDGMDNCIGSFMQRNFG